MNKLRIGTRGSALALKQAEMIKSELKKAFPLLQIELVILKTKGDKITDRPLYAIGGKGLFITEFEDALKNNEIDIAVHSGKDLPSETHSPFTIATVLKRGDVSDIVITKKETDIKDIKTIGTSSPRRIAMAKRLFNAKFENLRGNVPTRLQKLKDSLFDGIILAKAGIDRLNINLDEMGLKYYSPDTDKFVPASCQAIIACECIEGSEAEKILSYINHSDTKLIFDTERKLMCLLGADCHDAAGVYAVKESDNIKITAFYKNSDIISRTTPIENIEKTLTDMAGELKHE